MYEMAKKTASRLKACSFLFSLLRLDLLFHVDELSIGVVELVLQECEFLRWDNTYAEPVFQLPPPLLREEAFVDVGGNVGVDVQVEFLDANLVDEGVNFAL